MEPIIRWFVCVFSVIFFVACQQPPGSTANIQVDDGIDGETGGGSFTLTESQSILIRQAYGELNKQEWLEIRTTLASFNDLQLEEWFAVLDDYVTERDASLELASCSGYYGRQIGYGQFPYHYSGNYTDNWWTNCYFFNWNQCGADPVLSFWMNNSYRGNQSKLRAYADNAVARGYLITEGGFSGQVHKDYQAGMDRFNAYVCWPIEGWLLKDSARLRQLQ